MGKCIVNQEWLLKLMFDRNNKIDKTRYKMSKSCGLFKFRIFVRLLCDIKFSFEKGFDHLKQHPY